MKEDLKKMEKYSKEADLLGGNHIETAKDLSRYTERISAEYKSLTIERKKLLINSFGVRMSGFSISIPVKSLSPVIKISTSSMTAV